MANSQEESFPAHPDLLAAVVLHTLVSKGRGGIGATEVAVACERDPDEPGDMAEIDAALHLLLEDGLAACSTDRLPALYRPTRAAIRAQELSF